MSCKEIRNNIVTSYYGEITDKEKNEIESHIVICDNCREYYQQISQTLNHITQTKHSVPQPDWDIYLDKVYQKLTGRDLQEKRVVYSPPVFSMQKLVPVLATLFILVAFTGFFVGKKLVQQHKESNEIKQIVSEIEIYQNMELLQDLEIAENCDEILSLKKV